MKVFKHDLYRNGGGNNYITRFLFFLRLAQNTNNRFILFVLDRILYRYRLKYGLEISRYTSIGAGIYIGHAFNITINPNATIGKNCNIHKGVVIGQTNRGSNKGAPKIGNEVWIGINAAIVGGITIGDDVMIAPNSYINCDIPSHSVVYGNPCIVKHRENATECYINKKV